MVQYHALVKTTFSTMKSPASPCVVRDTAMVLHDDSRGGGFVISFSILTDTLYSYLSISLPTALYRYGQSTFAIFDITALYLEIL